MKSIKTNNSTKKIATISIIILLVLGAISAFLIYKNGASSRPDQNPDAAGKTKIDYNPPTRAQKEAGNAAKASTIENDQTKSNENTEKKLTAEITSAIIESNVLYVRSDIGGIHQNGTCTLTLTHNDEKIVKTSGIQPLPQSSTCKGFNIPTQNMTRGSWKINLKVVVDSISANASGEVDV